MKQNLSWVQKFIIYFFLQILLAVPAWAFRADLQWGNTSILTHVNAQDWTYLQDSQARLDAIRPALPSLLAAHIRPGPVDAEGWSLLVPNASVAAKLRQLQPRLEDTLRTRGWQITSIRIKVQSG